MITPSSVTADHMVRRGIKRVLALGTRGVGQALGRTLGYSFAIIGAVRRLTKAPVILTGKPSLRALRFVARKLGVPAIGGASA